MNRFANLRDAQEFLVSRIVAEAEREGISLSEVERKMLYFSETAPPLLPDIGKVNDEFDREYNQDDYEKKVARLIQNARKRVRKEGADDLTTWSEAERVLSRHDNFLQIMLKQADSIERPRGDLLKLWTAGLAVACLGVPTILLINYLKARIPRNTVFFVWLTALCASVIYSLFWHFRRERTEEVTDKIVKSLFGRFLGGK